MAPFGQKNQKNSFGHRPKIVKDGLPLSVVKHIGPPSPGLNGSGPHQLLGIKHAPTQYYVAKLYFTTFYTWTLPSLQPRRHPSVEALISDHKNPPFKKSYIYIYMNLLFGTNWPARIIKYNQ